MGYVIAMIVWYSVDITTKVVSFIPVPC